MTELDDRVTRLEIEMAEVRGIAENANREISHVPAVLQGHTRVLNAVRKTQREHGERLDRLEHKVDEGFAMMHPRFAEMDAGFAAMSEGFRQVDENFDTISKRFNQVGAGMAEITNLLRKADET